MPGKRRTREHVIADLGVNHVERYALLAGYTVDRFAHDYGLDLILVTCDEAGEVEPGPIYLCRRPSPHREPDGRIGDAAMRPIPR